MPLCSGLFLTAQQTCTAQCPSATFANKTSGHCAECSQGCSVCHNDQQCQRCRRGLYLDNGLCVEACHRCNTCFHLIPEWCSIIALLQQLTLIFEFPRGFPEGGICKPCSPECASCQGGPTHCLSCDHQYLLQDHSCRLQCLDGFYPAGEECHRCPTYCRRCTQDGLCTGDQKEGKKEGTVILLTIPKFNTKTQE